jgi:hypothetical protein
VVEVDYRLATVGVAGLVDDPAAVRREAIARSRPSPAAASRSAHAWSSASGTVADRSDADRHKTMATLRKDGSPRISGTEATFADGDPWLARCTSP